MIDFNEGIVLKQHLEADIKQNIASAERTRQQLKKLLARLNAKLKLTKTDLREIALTTGRINGSPTAAHCLFLAAEDEACATIPFAVGRARRLAREKLNASLLQDLKKQPHTEVESPGFRVRKSA